MTAHNTQIAPYPQALADLVAQVRTPGRDWTFKLAYMVRDPAEYGRGESAGLTLDITIASPDTRDPGRTARVRFLFPVPPATYDARSWQRWLFERCRDVDLHELCEAFALRRIAFSCGHVPACAEIDQECPDEWQHPYAPSHGPGNDPYMVREIGTEDDAEWRFNQPRPAHPGDAGS